jgi:hypothetical protein
MRRSAASSLTLAGMTRKNAPPKSARRRAPAPGLRPKGASAKWLERWAPPCPDGNDQRLCQILGFRLKDADYLQLRVVLGDGDNGVCQVVIDEHPRLLLVRAIVCLCADDGEHRTPRRKDEVDCPCNIVLDSPLGERVLVDVDTGAALPLFIPRWGTGEPSLYVPRPPGPLWPPDDMPSLD